MTHMSLPCPAPGTPRPWPSSAATLPFDALRHAYARSVESGWRKRSLLESAALERSLHRWETALLGPCARSR